MFQILVLSAGLTWWGGTSTPTAAWMTSGTDKQTCIQAAKRIEAQSDSRMKVKAICVPIPKHEHQ